MTSRTWSDGQIEALKEMVRHTRMTYDQIGERLGKPRGAVCAKVDRLGIGRRTAYAHPARQVIKKSPAPPLTNDVAKILDRHEKIAAERTLVALVDLGDLDCHFVFGDPKVSKAVYCGQPAVPGMAYCNSCVSRVYAPAEVTHHVAPEPQREEVAAPRVTA